MTVKKDSALTAQDEYTLTEQKPADRPEVKDYDTPKYFEKLVLTPEQQERLIREVWDELDAIKAERNERKLEAKWKALDSQYEGVVEEDELRAFNLCRRVTKIKVDAVERLVMKAFWKSDPKFSITARPEFERQGGEEVCQAQEDYLDYTIDNEIPFLPSERRTVHSAVVKGTGIKKWNHEIRREKRKRPECYDGTKKKPAFLPNGQPKLDEKRQPVFINTGLESFLRAYPDAPVQYPGFVKKLEEGKKISLMVEYEETTYNNPMPTHIPLKDFYVRVMCDGYEGMKTEKLLVERQNFSWWKLKKKEKQGHFYNIDELLYDTAEDKKVEKKNANHATKNYDILECTFHFKLNPSDEEEVKIICWIAEERKVVIGSILYPYHALDCVYNVKQIANIWEGFYQPGLAEYLTDNNIAENAILNFTLEGALAANTITPVAETDSPLHAQFLDKRWAHGVPLEKKKGEEVDFLNKYIGGFNHTQLLTLLEFLGRDDGDVVGVSQLVTGRESALDPNAPASKTLALLQQSGIHVEDYIDALSPAAARDADMILQIMYQMSEEGAKYRPRPDRVVGSDPFMMIDRQAMIARTNIQSQAKAFNMNEANEKVEDLALYKTVRMEPIIARNPKSVYVILKSLIKGWSPKWRNKIDEILPPLEQFQAEQQRLIAQGVAQFLQGKLQAAQQAGQEGFTDQPPVIAEQLMAVISDLVGESTTTPSPEVVAAREKEAKNAPQPV